MGGGIHGNFGKTLGMIKALSNNITNPILIKKKGDLRYNKQKMEKYLLNLKHPKGESKAKFLQDVLGYKSGDGKLLHKNIVKEMIGKKPVSSKKTEHGLKCTYNITLNGKSGKKVKANIVVVIQKDNNRLTYKIVTLYPNKKE